MSSALVAPITTPVRDAEGAPDLSAHGLPNVGKVHANLEAPALVEQALRRGEGQLTANGALVALTGERTGRSPQDRFVVAGPTQAEVCWGPVNRRIEPAVFRSLWNRAAAYLQGRELFVTDAWACADSRQRLSVRVITEKAWHALFARQLLLRPPTAARAGFRPQLTILHVADLRADPAIDGTRTGTFILLDLERGLVLIGGTHYAGEIKKSVFSYLNYLLPRRDVFSMHCSANIGRGGDTALFFGLSGTGKTTLSADPERRLIGDDEHGWSADGVFNFEGGCYAKCIRLSQAGEPQIWNAIRFGSVLENVVVDPVTRVPDYDDDHLTENTRAAYPVEHIDDVEPTGMGGHPANVVFLTCDAFGVLPPLARLSPEQAMYHFLSGYTAKVAGTETGISAPQTTFSTCFAAPFLPLQPTRYGDMLQEKLRRHGSQAWLVNTGWTGGPHGVGRRMPLAHTRAMLHAALSGSLEGVRFTPDPIFGMLVPEACPGVPSDLLQPRATWPDETAYDAQALKLAGLFQANFKAYEGHVTAAVRQAGPRV